MFRQSSIGALAFGEDGLAGATSYSTTTVTTSTSSSGGNDGDFLSGFDSLNVDVVDSSIVDEDTNSTSTTTTTTTTTSLQWSMTRSGYNPVVIDDDLLSYKILEGVDTLIEPHATNALFVTGITSDVYYRYQLCPEDPGSDCYYGVLSLNKMLVEETTIECEPYARYTVVIKEYNARTDAEEDNFEGTAQCMYVRREIRSLSDADLESTLDAMYALWSTEEEDGQELYGEDFHSASYLLKIHHFNAAWQDADHIHEGNGFLAQHMKMTNIFEKSMQAVDPSVTLPYWDFTIDESQGKSSFNSVVMTETFFGSMLMPNNISWGFTYDADNMTYGSIPDGRWAYLESPLNEDYPDLLAGYGYMRAPWNMNPSPYVSRFSYDYKIGISLPTCTEHYSILEETSLSQFMYDIQNGPHATTHSLAGGIYGCELMTPMREAGYLENETTQKGLCSKWVFYLKEFYRYGYIAPLKDCVVSDDVQSSTCGFECASDTLTLNLFMANLQTKLADYVPADMSVDGWYAWKDFVCTGDGGKIFSGDHLESASPHDPSFWVIHPTLERLYQAKMLAGGFKDAEWATDAQNDFVCDKAVCYSDATGTLEYGEDCCYGHYEDSQFLNFVSGNRSSHYGDTNGAIIKAADPTSADYSMGYIYDTFTWNHCSSDFQRLLVDMKEEMEAYVDEDEDKEEEEEAKVEADEEEAEQYVPTHKPTHSPDYIRPTNHPTTTGYTHRPTHHPSAKPTRQPTVTLEDMDEQPSSNSMVAKVMVTSSPTDTPTISPSKRPSRTLRPTVAPSSSKTKTKKSKTKNDFSEKKSSRRQQKKQASKDRM